MSVKIESPRIETCTVSVNVIKIGKKQMTLSVFDQLIEDKPFNSDLELNSNLWGFVKRKDKGRKRFSKDVFYLVFSKNESLFKWCFDPSEIPFVQNLIGWYNFDYSMIDSYKVIPNYTIPISTLQSAGFTYEAKNSWWLKLPTKDPSGEIPDDVYSPNWLEDIGSYLVLHGVDNEGNLTNNFDRNFKTHTYWRRAFRDLYIKNGDKELGSFVNGDHFAILDHMFLIFTDIKNNYEVFKSDLLLKKNKATSIYHKVMDLPQLFIAV